MIFDLIRQGRMPEAKLLERVRGACRAPSASGASPDPYAAEVFKWLASDGSLVAAKGGVTGACNRAREVYRISPTTGAVEAVGLNTAVFEKPFNLSDPMVRFCTNFTNDLAVAGFDVEGFTGWLPYNCSGGTDVIAAPMSGHTADSLIADASVAPHGFSTMASPAVVTAGRRVFISAFAKPGASNYAALALNVSGDPGDPFGTLMAQVGVAADLVAGAITLEMDFLGGGTLPSSSFAIPVGGGWCHFGFTLTTPPGTGAVSAQTAACDPAGGLVFAGDGTTVSSYWWGFSMQVDSLGWHPVYLPSSTALKDQVTWATPAAVSSALAGQGTLVLGFVPAVNKADAVSGMGIFGCQANDNSLVAYSTGAGGIFYSTDGTNYPNVNFAFSRGVLYLLGVQWGRTGNKMRIGYRAAGGDWVWGTETAFDGAFTSTGTLYAAYNIGYKWGFFLDRIIIRNDDPSALDMNALYAL